MLDRFLAAALEVVLFSATTPALAKTVSVPLTGTATGSRRPSCLLPAAAVALITGTGGLAGLRLRRAASPR